MSLVLKTSLNIIQEESKCIAIVKRKNDKNLEILSSLSERNSIPDGLIIETCLDTTSTVTATQTCAHASLTLK